MNDNIPYNEVSSSSIPPGRPAAEVTYDDLIQAINEYTSRSDLSVTDRQSFERGLAKQLPAKFTLHRFIAGLNMLMHDYIRNAGKTNTLQHSAIIAEYFNGVNSMSKILDNVDIEVAETEFLCYIIGYTFKMLKHFKDNNQNI